MRAGVYGGVSRLITHLRVSPNSRRRRRRRTVGFVIIARTTSDAIEKSRLMNTPTQPTTHALAHSSLQSDRRRPPRQLLRAIRLGWPPPARPADGSHEIIISCGKINKRKPQHKTQARRRRGEGSATRAHNLSAIYPLGRRGSLMLLEARRVCVACTLVGGRRMGTT